MTVPLLRIPAEPEARAPAIAAALQAIQAADPAFSVDALLGDLPDRYLKIRRARAEGDTNPLAEYVAPALLALWQDSPGPEGLPPQLEDLSVQEVRLVWAAHDRQGDRLTVGVDCLSESGGEIHTLTEYWTLARPPGTATADAIGAGQCPNCGAPTLGETDLCRYCGVALPGPLQGWLLGRVDHEIDWYEAPPGSVF